jgi:putative ATPase
MIEGGEDPLYIARRLIRFASEDIGLANPGALSIAISSYEASHYIGVPECNVNLAEAVVYLSVSPKSNSIDVAYQNAKRDAIETMNEPVPLHLRNAVTKLDESLGNGKGYQYAHNYEEHVTKMDCMPKKLKGHTYYTPTEIGKEKNVKEVLDKIKEFKNK